MKTRIPLTETERERAKVMHASGKTPSAIAKIMGRSHHTLQKFLDKPEIHEQVAIQREVLASMCDSIVHRIGSAVTDTDIQKAPLKDKLISMGIGIDKAAQLRNEVPPTINVTVLLDAMHAFKKLRDREDARHLAALPAPGTK